ncbi:MAG: BarJ [Candidatus Moranbacteria bacterium GW2011_GWA2_39_41]|nr:MAG: BarJ [Candidatus Moranbacteria bacterium GW2011_GWA2_39_41]
MENKADVIIFGAGPSGLAGANKLIKNNKSVIIFEREKIVGGISKTLEFKGNRFDLGGHRFFTKSKEVNELWDETLRDDFLIRPRLSRIYYQNKFFDYPIKAMNALLGLGILTSVQVLLSYIVIQIKPYQEEKTFEQWVSNRFGKKLFNVFFKTYTEKLWGIPCNQIQAEWAAQRIRGLSMASAIKNALFHDKSGKIKTLIDEFKYPKFGPGMMYEKMAENIVSMGGQLSKEHSVIKINHNNFTTESVIIQDTTGSKQEYFANNFLSSMPITELIKRLSPSAPTEVLEAAQKLTYRSFIAISVILKSQNPFPDTWIYIHSPEVKMGRIQNFKAWSPFMIADETQTTLGLEYFCTEGDDFWNMPDKDLLILGMQELEKIGLGKQNDFVDGFVARVPKAYPVYDATYPTNIKIVREYLEKFTNLQPIGRYGMFKYNNMDHSILTGIYAADNIINASKRNIWNVNADQEYHEEKNNLSK